MDFETPDFAFDPVEPWPTAAVFLGFCIVAGLLWLIDARAQAKAEQPVSAKRVFLACVYALVSSGLVAYVLAVALRIFGVAAVGEVIDVRASSLLEWLTIVIGVTMEWIASLAIFIVPPVLLASIAVARAGRVERSRARLVAMVATCLAGAIWVGILALLSMVGNDWCGVQPSALQVAAARALRAVALPAGLMFGGLALAQRTGTPRLDT